MALCNANSRAPLATFRHVLLSPGRSLLFRSRSIVSHHVAGYALRVPCSGVSVERRLRERAWHALTPVPFPLQLQCGSEVLRCWHFERNSCGRCFFFGFGNTLRPRCLLSRSSSRSTSASWSRSSSSCAKGVVSVSCIIIIFFRLLGRTWVGVVPFYVFARCAGAGVMRLVILAR